VREFGLTVKEAMMVGTAKAVLMNLGVWMLLDRSLGLSDGISEGVSKR